MLFRVLVILVVFVHQVGKFFRQIVFFFDVERDKPFFKNDIIVFGFADFNDQFFKFLVNRFE